MKLSPETILDENYCVCMIRNALTIFVFWKFSNYYLKLFQDGVLSSEIRLRVFEPDGKCFVDVPAKYFWGGYHISLPRFTERVRVGIFCFENGIEKNLCFSDDLILSFEKEFKKDYNFYNEKN